MIFALDSFSAKHVLRFLVVLCLSNGWLHAADNQDPLAKWDPEIRAFQAAERTNQVPPNPIVFVGSSSIRMWKTLAEDFKGLPVVNRGFGGSQVSDSVALADRIILPYRPKQVFVYAGDNDLAAGKSPEQVRHDFQDLVRKIQGSLPETQITYISIKPSPSRWQLAAQMRTANRLIADFTKSDPRLGFVDVFTPMLGEDGKPRPELFLSDKLHMNRQGYELWTRLIGPRLR